jgi:hypothetical protein
MTQHRNVLKKKDLFISHASEDKDDFVRPLANLLRQYGLEVWYDEFELTVGKSVSRSIDKGISNSKFGLLVLSNTRAKCLPRLRLGIREPVLAG